MTIQTDIAALVASQLVEGYSADEIRDGAKMIRVEYWELRESLWRELCAQADTVYPVCEAWAMPVASL